MVICPMLKIEASADYNPKKPQKGGHPPQQLLITWEACVSCNSNRGHDLKKRTIQCGYDTANIITLGIIPSRKSLHSQGLDYVIYPNK